MPALEAYGRVWKFGSDDLFFPVLILVVIRVLWFIGLLGGVLYFREALACEPAHYIAGFSSALLFITLIEILLETALTIFSACGSIVHVKPRRPIAYLIFARTIVFILEFILLVVGTVLAVLSTKAVDDNNLDCPNLDTMVILMYVVVAIYWLAFVLCVVMAVTFLDPCHSYSTNMSYSRIEEGDGVVETNWRLVHRVWEKRFKVACCKAGDDHKMAYREMAEIFAHLFCDTNLVLSDIVAGFLLLQKEQLEFENNERVNRRRINVDHVDQDAEFIDPDNLFRDAQYFIKYILGEYNWPLYVYMHPLHGLCRLYTHLNCCGRQNEVPHIRNDNRCSCHIAGLRQFTGLNEEDIIYASFENGLYMVPFIVCLDHEMRSVVIAFRGTFSFVDIVTDLTANTVSMELPDHPDFLVHSGTLKTAKAILNKLDKEDILESAFSRVNGREYNLVTVGHSLGSGCACIMSILLRNRYPNLRCFSYSPMGTLLNEEAAIYTEDFVTSVTLGIDVIARMSAPNTHKLKNDLVRVIEACRKPKCQILCEGTLETFFTCFGSSYLFSKGYVNRTVEFTRIIRPNLSSLQLPITSSSRNSNDSSSTNSSMTEEVARRLVPLFPPGKIIHIMEMAERKPCFCDSRQLEVRWASRNDFDKLRISPDMIRDHLPQVLYRAVNKVWNRMN